MVTRPMPTAAPTSALAHTVTALEDHGQPRCGIAHCIAIWLWLGWISNYGLMIGAAVAFGVLGWHRSLVVLATVVGVLVAVPKSLGKDSMMKTVGAWIAHRAAEYLAFSVYLEDAEELRRSEKPFIFALEPHGVLPVSILAFHDALRLIPVQRTAGLMTSAVFYLPGMKNVYTWLSARTVDRATFDKLLTTQTSCCFCPGGVQEVAYLTDSSEVTLFLKSRLGFARLALRHGCPVRVPAPRRHLCTQMCVPRTAPQVVPCFTFGLSESFTHWFPKGPVATAIGRKLGFMPGMYWGLWGIPFGPPRPRPLGIVVGKPIPLPPQADPTAKPTDEMVKAYHADFLRAMEALFDQYKANFGYADATLRIL